MTKKSFFTVCAIVILVAQSAFAQVTGGGFPPYGTFANSDFDTINVGNLNVHLTVPIFSKAGRGLPISYSMSYDNSIWTPVAISNWAWKWVPATSNVGWRATGDLTDSVTYTLYQAPPSACGNGNPFVA